MSRYPSAGARGVAATLAVLLALTVTSPPLAAAGTPQKPRQTTLAAAAATKAAASSDHAVTIAPTQEAGGAAAGESKPFFKTGKGIAALVLMIGATGWVIASRKSDDVVHSPGRE